MANSDKIARKGMCTVEQGAGYPFKSKGTNFVGRDLDTLFNWFATGRGAHVDPIPRDLDGVPHRLCSNGHYSPIAAYDKNAAREDGLDNYCKQCRSEIQRKWRVQEAEANGRKLNANAGRPKKFVNQPV